MKEIDVLLPFHVENSELYAAINSIQDSETVKVRFILIDDRQNPESLAAAPHNSKVINTFGVGYARALNAAKEFILSPYTAIMNSDDLVHPRRFSSQIQKLVEQEAQLCACGLQKFRGRKNAVSQFGNLQLSGYLDRRVLLLGAYGVDATWCGKSDWWINNLEFLDQQMSDWATGMEVSRRINIYFYNEKLYYYRQHTNQTTADSAFSSFGLKAMMNSWLLLARQSNIQELTPREVAWVAAPRGRKPLDKISIEKITDWLSEFNHVTKGIYSDLISRRYLLLISSYPLNRYTFKELLYSASAINSLAIENFLNLTNSRNRRVND